MKQLLSLVLIVATAFTAFTTGQITEKINDNGVDKGLTRCLLERDSTTFSKLKERVPDGVASTALWRGYIGHWKIKNDSLFLDSVLVHDMASDAHRFIPAKINDIYAARCTPSGYFADWVTDTLRIVSGEIVLYKHMGWDSSWENEEFVAVKDGQVKDRIVYKNCIVNPVNNSENRYRELIDSLNLGFIPKRIALQLGYEGFDEEGNPTGYKVKVIRGSGDTAVDSRVVSAFRDPAVMRRLIPIYKIRGQYKAPEVNIAVPKSRTAESISN